MATKKISELEAITEADGSDALVIVDISEGKTNKITKNNLLKGSGHTIEMSLNENYQIVLKLKNTEGTELSTATIDLPNENAITNITYNNGKLTLTKQSGSTTEVDISGLINGLATETALTNLANALKETIGIQTNTYNESQTYNTGDIVVQNEKIYKANQDNITGTFDSSKWDEISLYEYQKLQDEAIEENYKVITKLQEDVEDLTERMEDAENNEMTYTPTPSTSHYLQDSADSRFRKFIPIGRTTQESTTGANVLPFTARTNTGSGATYTCDEKGQVTWKGTTQYNQYPEYNNGITTPLEPGNYKLKVIGKATGITFSYTGAYSWAETLHLDSNQEATITITEAVTDFKIKQGVEPNTTYNCDYYITLAKGTTATTERYTGGEPAPNPIYPYAIKNTGDNVNLEPVTLQSGISGNITYTVNKDKSITFNGTNGSNDVWIRLADNYVLPAGTYTMSNGNKDASSASALFVDDGANFERLSQDTKTFANDVTIKPYIRILKNVTLNNFTIYPKIEQGTKATPYSPYGCGNVNEKVQNKNVIIGTKNNIGIYADNGQILEISGRYCQYCKVTAGEQYTISRKSVGTSSYFYYGFYGEELKEGIVPVNRNFGNMGNDTLKFTTPIAPNGAKYLVVFYGIGLSEEPMIEQGSTATDYITHSEQNISFPLAEGQKFYEGDYLADDGVHHKMGEVVFDGTVGGYNADYNWFYLSFTNLQIQKPKTLNILSNYFKYYNRNEFANDTSLNGISFNTADISTASTFVIRNTNCTNATEYKNWLAEVLPIVQYELAEEQTEDFTSEQQTAWEEIKKARTYKNVTHISSEDETPANVEVEYVQDTKTYIDNQIEPLKSAIISLGGNV